jgi:hypothetical protein
MKSIQNKKNNWTKINKVILRVDSVDLRLEKKMSVFLDCGFENISRGRCGLTVNEKIEDSVDHLFIHTDKALMEVNVYYDSLHLEKLAKFISYKRNTTKKIKISLVISDSLMVNQSGDLYINDDVKITIKSISWGFPII